MHTGFALSASNQLFQRSKAHLIANVENLLNDFHFDDVSILNDAQQVKNIKLEYLRLDQALTNIHIREGKVAIEAPRCGGRLTAHSSRKKLFN